MLQEIFDLHLTILQVYELGNKSQTNKYQNNDFANIMGFPNGHCINQSYNLLQLLQNEVPSFIFHITQL